MARFSKDCIDAILLKLKDFSKEEIESYMSDVFSTARKYNDLGSRASINKAIREVNNKKLEALFEETIITVNNAKKFERISSMISNGKINLNEVSIRSRSDKNKDFNIQSAQVASHNKFYKIFYDELTAEETKFLIDPNNSEEIGRAIDGKEASKEAKSIAKVHHKLVDSINADLVISNAMPLYNLNKRRQINAVHDRRKILNPGKSFFKIISSKDKYTTDQSKKLWMDNIKKYLDLEETYYKIGAVDKHGNLDMEHIDKSLSNTFDNIVNGYSEIFTQSGVKNDFEEIKKRQRLFFVWKDTESWLKYNNMYGTGDYHSALQSYIRSSSSKVGSAEIFGDSPSNMFFNLMDVQIKTDPKTSRWRNRTENAFKYITGIDQIAVDPTLAAFGSNIRSWTGMARLGSVGLLSMGDVVKGASHVSQFGFGFWGPLVNNIVNIFNNKLFTNDERKYIAKVFKLNLDSHMGYMGKFIDATTTGDFTSKFTNAFYRLNLMKSLDDGNKISVMHMMAKGLANMSKNSYENLGEDLKRQLSKYNITPDEWNILRKKNKNGLFTTDNLDGITDEELSLIRGVNDNRALYEIKNELYRKIYTLFDVASMTAVGQPDVYIKSFLLGDTKAGTAWGEVLRAFIQFKAFPLQHIDRMYINNFKDSGGVKNKIIYFMNTFIASFGLNMLSNSLDYLSKGQSIPDINKMSVPEKVKFFMQNFDANIGLLYKGFNNSYPGKFKAMYLLSSPSTDFIGNIIDVMVNSGMALTGDKDSWERAVKSAKSAAAGIMPSSTIPILSPYMNELMGDKSYLQPGQRQLFGK